MKTRILLNDNKGNQRIGVDVMAGLVLKDASDLRLLDAFLDKNAGRTKFIMLSYELGREILFPGTVGSVDFPLVEIWVPESVFEVRGEDLLLTEGKYNPENLMIAAECIRADKQEIKTVEWRARQTKEDYTEAVKILQSHIQRGDIYETNYCQEFYADPIDLPEGSSVYHALNEVTKAPFSVYFESDEWMIASASPERFLKRSGNKLLSQPIKGTAPRHSDPATDDAHKDQLLNSEKERAENVMIVDLVRNDLSRVAAKNSVQVDELFGIHTFPTVHQMISTISCELKPGTGFSDILEATFPMGSMTGAPKVSAVRLSDRHERFSRGIYSGSIGYIDPNGDFDLNVMIRSLVYDKQRSYLSCGVGGAITIASDPEAEYEECKTKVGRILQTFGTCTW